MSQRLRHAKFFLERNADDTREQIQGLFSTWCGFQRAIHENPVVSPWDILSETTSEANRSAHVFGLRACGFRSLTTPFFWRRRSGSCLECLRRVVTKRRDERVGG